MRTSNTIRFHSIKVALSIAIAISFILFPALSFARPTTVQPVKSTLPIELNGSLMSFNHAPYLQNGHAMVPIRELANQLGAQVHWDEQRRSVMIQKEAVVITFPVHSSVAELNDQTIQLSQPIQIIEDISFAPLRFLAESLNARVSWDHHRQTVHIDLVEKLTPAQAEEAVRNHLNIADKSETIVEFDFQSEEDVYAIHVYQIVDSHTTTLGWYLVDAASGSIESMF